MGIKLPENMQVVKTKSSGTAKAASEDNSLISSIISKNKSQSSSTEETTTSNNKDGTLSILARGVKELLPSIGKGITSAVDDISDAVDSYVYASDQKKAERSGRYSLMEKAAESKKRYEQASSKHALGSKVQQWEDDVTDRQSAILEDNPDSKLAEVTVKGLGLGESVGRMLPSVGLSMATGGVGGAVLGQAVGLGSMAMSVYDSSFDESMEKGYDTVSAGKKALGDAMLETGTELLFGGIAGLGKGVVNANTSKRFTDMVSKVGASEVADKAVRKFGVKGAVLGLSKATVRATEIAEEKTFRGLMMRSFGEGAEEMISEAVSPFIERATVNPHADDATFAEIVEAGIGGALISFAMAPLGKIETQLDARKQARIAKEQEAAEAAFASDRAAYKSSDVEYQYAMLSNIAFDESISAEDAAIVSDKLGYDSEKAAELSFKLDSKINKRLASEYIRKAREAGSTPEAMAELWENFRNLVDEETTYRMDYAASKSFKSEVIEKKADEAESVKAARDSLDEAITNREDAQIAFDKLNTAKLDRDGAEATTAGNTNQSRRKGRAYNPQSSAYQSRIRQARAKLTNTQAAVDTAQKSYDDARQAAIGGLEAEYQTSELQRIENEFGKEMVDSFTAYQRTAERAKGMVIVNGSAYTQSQYENLTKTAQIYGGEQVVPFEELLKQQKAQAAKELEDFVDEANRGLVARGLNSKLSVEINDSLSSGDAAQYLDGVITFAADKVQSTQAAQYYMAHELLHAMSDKVLAQESKNAFYEDIVNAAKTVGFDYDSWYTKIAGIYSDRYEGLSEEQVARKLREETCARFMQTAFGSQGILESLALVNPEMLSSMRAEIEQSSVKRFDGMLWDYERLKILDRIDNAIARPRDVESNAEKIASEIATAEAVEAGTADAAELAEAEAAVGADGFTAIDEERLRQYNALREKYGSFDKYGLPQKINSNVATSKFANRMYKSRSTDDTLKQRMQSDLLDGAYTHLIMTDKDAISHANEFIRNKATMSAAYTSVRDLLQNGTMNKNDIAVGEQMLIEVRDRINEINEANKTVTQDEQKDTSELYNMFEELLGDLCAAGTRAGQNLQAFSLIKKMTPQGRLYYIDSQVTNLLQEMYNKSPLIDRSGASMVGGYRFVKDSNGNYIKDKNGKMIEIRVSEELRDKMLNCTTAEELDAVEQEIISDIASKIPPTVMDRVTAWRYLAMLGNPRTHIRNIVSNVVMGSTIKVKNKVGGVLEDVILGSKTEGRTKTVSSNLTYEEKAALKEFAKKDWDLDGVSDTAMSGGKVGFQSRIRQEMAALGFKDFKALDKISKFNSNALEAEDSWSGRKAYTEAFTVYGATHNFTTDFLNSGTVEANTKLAQARSYAIREAAKATYHDASIVATYLNKIENSTGALGKLIVGGLLPFKKTPVNIIKRGVDYSPVGLVNGLFKTVQAIRTPVENFQGEYSALNSADAKDIGKANARFNAEASKTRAVADAIDLLAAGLTGTGLLMVGLLAGKMGIMKASGSDNDKEEYYDQMLGNQQYSITIGDTNYTLDWLTPVSMPLFAGVEAAKFLTERSVADDGTDTSAGFDFEDLLSIMARLADPVTNLSVLQGINDAMSSYDGGITRFATSALESYAGQFVPTIAGQVARSIDPIRRSTYAPKTGDTNAGKKINTFINRMENKIPGLSQDNAAYVDMWGRTEENYGGSFIGRLFANSVAPWYAKKQNKTEADDYITALFSVTDDRSVIPNSIEKSYTFDGERVYMESDEYQQEQEIVGQLSHIGVTSLMAVNGYGDLTPDEQATLVGNVYSFAKAVAEADYAKSKGYTYDEERKNVRLKEAVNAGLSIGEALYVDYVANSFSADKDSNGKPIRGSKKKKVINFYHSMGLTSEQIAAINI